MRSNRWEPPWADTSNLSFQFRLKLSNKHRQIYNSLAVRILAVARWDTEFSRPLATGTLDEIRQWHFISDAKVLEYSQDVSPFSDTVAVVIRFPVCSLWCEVEQLFTLHYILLRLVLLLRKKGAHHFTEVTRGRFRQVKPKWEELKCADWLVDRELDQRCGWDLP